MQITSACAKAAKSDFASLEGITESGLVVFIDPYADDDNAFSSEDGDEPPPVEEDDLTQECLNEVVKEMDDLSYCAAQLRSDTIWYFPWSNNSCHLDTFLAMEQAASAWTIKQFPFWGPLPDGVIAGAEKSRSSSILRLVTKVFGEVNNLGPEVPTETKRDIMMRERNRFRAGDGRYQLMSPSEDRGMDGFNEHVDEMVQWDYTAGHHGVLEDRTIQYSDITECTMNCGQYTKETVYTTAVNLLEFSYSVPIICADDFPTQSRGSTRSCVIDKNRSDREDSGKRPVTFAESVNLAIFHDGANCTASQRGKCPNCGSITVASRRSFDVTRTGGEEACILPRILVLNFTINPERHDAWFEPFKNSTKKDVETIEVAGAVYRLVGIVYYDRGHYVSVMRYQYEDESAEEMADFDHEGYVFYDDLNFRGVPCKDFNIPAEFQKRRSQSFRYSPTVWYYASGLDTPQRSVTEAAINDYKARHPITTHHIPVQRTRAHPRRSEFNNVRVFNQNNTPRTNYVDMS